MKKILLAMVVGVLLIPSIAQAKKSTIYRQANNPANIIKLDKIGSKEATELQLNHPYTFSEDQMADILRSIRFNRRALFSQKVKTRHVYEEEYIEKYTPLLVKAFKEVGPKEVVYFSLAQQRPLFIIRNDRLTSVRMWVSGQELHIDFLKTEAKLQGDYKQRTQQGRRLIEDSKGLRISLEPQEGQKFAFDSSDEIILDLSANWEAIVTKIEAEEKRIKEQMELEKAKGSRKKKIAKQQAQSQRPPVSEKDRKTAEERLGELKKLKDKGLINEQDYERKKQEILENL